MGTAFFSVFLLLIFTVGCSGVNLEVKGSLAGNGNGTAPITRGSNEVKGVVVVGDGVRSNISELVGSKDGLGKRVSGSGSGLVRKDQDGRSKKSSGSGSGLVRKDQDGGGKKSSGFGSGLVRTDQDGGSKKSSGSGSGLVRKDQDGGDKKTSGFGSGLVRKDRGGVRSNGSELVRSKDGGGGKKSSRFGSNLVGKDVRSNVSELVESKNGGGKKISGFESGLVQKDQDGVRTNVTQLDGSKNGEGQKVSEFGSGLVGSKDDVGQEVSGSGSGSGLVQKDQDGVRSNVSELVGSKDGVGQENGSGLVQKDEELKEGSSEVTSALSRGIEKEKLRDEECDPSYMCVDEMKNLSACLRVPGNDSPDLSLLIQNRGKKPVTVTITAPEFVQLEETEVQLQEEEDKKVKVSVTSYRATNTIILLTATDTHCKLDLKDLIRHNPKVKHSVNNFTHLTRTHLIIFLTLTALLLLLCGWAYMGPGPDKKLMFGNGYKPIDLELPVSVPVSTPEMVMTSDDWDKGWSDGWGDGDEEAAMTPRLPVTPNVSSIGLAPRRMNKEGWKD